MRSEGYCSWVCLCVCRFNISPLERLFILKTISRTQQATKVKKIVGIPLNPLCCRDPALPALCGRPPSAIFRYAVKRTCASTRDPISSSALGATPSKFLAGHEFLRVALQRAEGLHFSAFH